MLRKLQLLARLAGAVALGSVFRLARRVAQRQPRIWHGHWPVVMTPEMVRVDRLAGYPSRSVASHTKLLKYTLITDDQFDRILLQPGVAPDSLHWRAMIDMHLHADIWVAHFDCHPFPYIKMRENRVALRIARLAGIRIIALPHGTDILRKDKSPTRYDWIGRIERDYPSWDLDRQTSVSRRRIRLFSELADFVIAPDPATAQLMERVDLVFKYPTVSGLEPRERRTPGPVRIVHAPNHREVKGTQFLIDACAMLRTVGFDFELVLVEGVARKAALAIYADADLIADQFCIGASGVFGLEGLALGKPVLVYLDDEHLANPALNLPFVQATPENLKQVLAPLITSAELRQRLGSLGRHAFEEYQSAQVLAEVWDRIYRHVWRGEPLALETTRHFSAKRQARPLTEDPSAADFWPVTVSDLLPAIRSAINLAR